MNITIKKPPTMKCIPSILLGAIITSSQVSAATILSSEDWEATTTTSDWANTDYTSPTSNAFTDVANIASTGGPGSGSDPSGKHVRIRSSSGRFELANPLALATGAYTSVEVSYAMLFNSNMVGRTMRLEYSALGNFSDTQTVKTHTGTAYVAGATPTNPDYEVTRWYADQTVTLSSGTYTFTDTAKFRWYNGGTANSHSTYLDDIVITGIPVPEPSSAVLIGLSGFMLILRRRKS
ncbi:MAG: PEP-CTERM sorting domain-containing protein [Verrucomicrobiae bacterium]|nr:PEP-CTERM sorting domain-containing protein [Verrucomicrobiae bacterium]NNJ42470.1 PEP-CTERM sorting domain-containing protein [Akkermansiaceae bacterium]